MARRRAPRRDELAGAEVAFAQSTDEAPERGRAALDAHVARCAARAAAAPRLARAVCEQLASLAMRDATFEVAADRARGRPRRRRRGRVPDRSQPRRAGRPLREIASGGELSRVMLA